jgi:hypothetical protein
MVWDQLSGIFSTSWEFCHPACPMKHGAKILLHVIRQTGSGDPHSTLLKDSKKASEFLSELLLRY